MRSHRDIRLEQTARDHSTDRSAEQAKATRAVLYRVENCGLDRADAHTILSALGLDAPTGAGDLPLQVPW